VENVNQTASHETRRLRDSLI